MHTKSNHLLNNYPGNKDLTARIRVLHLTSSRGFYGAENALVNLISKTDFERFDVYIACLVDKRDPNRELLKVSRERGWKAIEINCCKRLDLSSIKLLIEILKRNRIDILHCHEEKSRFYGLIGSRIAGLPIIATNHNWTKPNIIESCYEIIDAVISRFFNRIISVSDELRKTMRRYKIPSKVITVIPNGINLESFVSIGIKDDHQQVGLGINRESKVIGSIGRLTVEKGHKYLLEAARQVAIEYPNIRFIIAGEGPLKLNLQNYASFLNIEKFVHFIGFRKDIHNIYSLLDILALASTVEGTPMVLLEAMAMGIPVVSTDVGGIKNIIDHQSNGLLIKPRNPNALAESILYLLGNDRESKRLADNARKTVQQKFSDKRMAREYEKVYCDVLKSHSHN
jgi:glycosyltransferase involved in cell wall biosynthesis